MGTFMVMTSSKVLGLLAPAVILFSSANLYAAEQFQTQQGQRFKTKMVCDRHQFHRVGLQLTTTAKQNFLKNDQRPQAQKTMTHEQKVQKVLAAIEKVHAKKGIEEKTGGYTKEQYANTIVWAADCTGNDLKWVASIIGHESAFCGWRISQSKTGGDAGCGQWTPDGLNEVKNQLRVSNRKGSGSKGAYGTLHSMLKQCYAEYGNWVPGSGGAGNYQGFLNVMGQPNGRRIKGTETFPKGTIREDFRHARAVDADILAVGILLKVKAAQAGGYVVAGSKPGGIASYNGGGVKGYYGKVNSFGNKYLHSIDVDCLEDTYTSEVAELACEMELFESHDQCQVNFEDAITNEYLYDI